MRIHSLLKAKPGSIPPNTLLKALAAWAPSGEPIPADLAGKIEHGGRFCIREALDRAFDGEGIDGICSILEAWSQRARPLPLNDDRPAPGELPELAARSWGRARARQRRLDDAEEWEAHGLRAMRAAARLEEALGWREERDARSAQEVADHRLAMRLLSRGSSGSSAASARAWILFGADPNAVFPSEVDRKLGGHSMLESSLMLAGEWRLAAALADHGARAAPAAWGNARQAMSRALSAHDPYATPEERARGCASILRGLDSDFSRFLGKTPQRFEDFALRALGPRLDGNILRALASEGARFKSSDLDTVLEIAANNLENDNAGARGRQSTACVSAMLGFAGPADYSPRWRQLIQAASKTRYPASDYSTRWGACIAGWARDCSWTPADLSDIAQLWPEMAQCSEPFKARAESLAIDGSTLAPLDNRSRKSSL